MEIKVNWEEAYKLWKEFEGLELTAYPDPATGNEPWTIGYGHTGQLSGTKVKRGDKITREQAVQLMQNDLNAIVKKLEPLIKVQLNENQWAALCSFSANLKWNTFLKSSVLRYINENRLAEVPGRMALYRLGNGKVMNGLVRRRAAEGVLWVKSIADTVAEAKVEAKVEVVATQGVEVKPAQTKKPWDWGVVGIVITSIASFTDEIKKILTDLTSGLGVPPIAIVAIVIVGFAGWTLWNKWQGDK